MTNQHKIIDGKAAAARLRERVKRQVAALHALHGLVPGLAAVLVGDDPASHAYVRSKERQAVEAGLASRVVRLPATTSQGELLEHVNRLNSTADMHGILVQMPLPPQIALEPIVEAIDPLKDVDGFHPVNVGRLAGGHVHAALVPCTPLGCLRLLEQRLGRLAGLHAVVLGRSMIVGRPVAQLLLRADCTVTIAHSRTRDLPALCRQADILVAAVGRPEMVRGDWIKPGATVIDVGISRVPAPTADDPRRTRLIGDVAFAEALPRAGAITPVPGGVGPMTIACLLENTLRAACRQAGVQLPQPE